MAGFDTVANSIVKPLLTTIKDSTVRPIAVWLIGVPLYTFCVNV